MGASGAWTMWRALLGMAVLDLTAASFLSPPQVHSRRRTTLSTERACGALACADAGLDEQQLKYMEEERIILVDIHDRVLGAQSKVSSHLCEYGPLLHRAFSVFLFDSQGRMLLQKRAAEKITFPNHWTNTCCSHPLYTPHEMGTDLTPADPLLGVKRAAIRKLGHELGIPASELPLESMTYMGRIHYIADSDDRWGEHEIDYVFFIQADVTLEANANEVCETAYMSAEEGGELFGTAESKGVKVTPWARHIVEQFVFDWWKSLGDQQKLEEQAEFEVIHRMGVCAHPEWSDPSQLYHPETTPMREVGGEGGVRTVQKS